MRLDTHQHFWELANDFTVWPPPEMAAIHRDFVPADIAGQLATCRIEGTILVQAAPDSKETDYCLALGRQHGFVRGVVGWIDFEAADALDQLNRRARDPLLKGLRLMIQSVAEPNWLLGCAFTPLFHAMADRGLPLDGLVLSHQIAELDVLARRHPELAIVLDHAGKPPIQRRHRAAWSADIARLAANPNVFCKLSGLWTEAGADCSVETIRPWVDHLLATFGPDRLMWGSDWPVIEQTGSYRAWHAQCEAMLSHVDVDARAAVFGGTGGRFYDIA
jgi:L-fuconolactonase